MKVLGVIGLIDGGETDWKLISIDIKDPEAKKLNSLADIEYHKPSLLNATVKWFQEYKIPEGKPKNIFAFDGEPQDSEFAKLIIDEVHDHWIHLMKRENDMHSIYRSCTTCGYTSQISKEDAEDLLDDKPELDLDTNIQSEANKVHYCR